MLYTRRHLAVVRVAGDENRTNFLAIEPSGRTWATDGHILATYIDAPDQPGVEDLPAPPKGVHYLQAPCDHLRLRSDAAERLAKALPRSPKIPILEAAVMVSLDANGAAFAVSGDSGLDVISVPTAHPDAVRQEAKETFKHYTREAPKASIHFDPKILGEAAALAKSINAKCVRLDFWADDGPVRVTARDDRGVLTVLAAPFVKRNSSPAEPDAELDAYVPPTPPEPTPAEKALRAPAPAKRGRRK